MPILEELLARGRNELLDLSTRNRLLAIPVGSASARIVTIADERGDQVFRLLVTEKRSLGFLPGRAQRATPKPGPAPAGAAGGSVDGDDEAELPPPDEEEDTTTGLPRRHVDTRLQTALTPEGLQRRLLDLHRDAQTMIEEQGVNVLFLALGQLKWFEDDDSDIARHAPLVLVPVKLTRRTASERFVLSRSEEDLEENLSLRAKLQADFELDLPEFPAEEELDFTRYCDAVAKTIAGAPRWEVLPHAITLGFFSFAKFLMYRDLEPRNWPEGRPLLEHPFVRGLLVDGFPAAEAPFAEDTHLDELIPADRLDHVVDADGSQSLAIEAVRRGRSVVIQGPPGTGKSQSIANIIATAVLDGRRVLFVAEKLAALEVVKRRLEREGLGDLCLELHSHKANKRAVVEAIAGTWKLGRPKAGDSGELVSRLESRRATLNTHVAVLHERHEPSGLTPFRVIGQLTALGGRGGEADDLAFAGAEGWTPATRAERRRLVEELAERITRLGLPVRHPWRGVGRATVLKIDVEPLLRGVRNVGEAVDALSVPAAELAALLGQPVPGTFLDVEHLRRMAEFAATVPPHDRTALVNSVWDAGLDGLRTLVQDGRRFARAVEQTGGSLIEAAWERDFSSARMAVAAHGRSWLRFLNGEYRRAMAEIRGCLAGKFPEDHEARVEWLDNVVGGQQAGRRIRAGEALGRSAWGAVWKAEKTDWAAAEAILDWIDRQREAGLGAEFRGLVAGLADPAAVGRRATELGRALAAAREQARRTFADLVLDPLVAFGVPDADLVSLPGLQERVRAWLAAPEELSRWTSYYACASAGRTAGLEPLIERLERGAVPAEAAAECFDRVYFGQLLREMVARRPELARFDGDQHERRIEEFRRLDRDRLVLAKQRVLAAHHGRLPDPQAGVGAIGILKGEMERKRGHRPVRRLLIDAGSVVQAIKPVFLMSPLSVAQFLAPGAVEFDLLVVDEASQVQPVDALGAVARARQIVVVGDSRQLPPTRFFARLTTSEGDGPADDADGNGGGAPQAARAEEVESILGLCRARGLPERMLRWHYRSRHHSLIAVSNREFYDDRLFIVPSPFAAESGRGLEFRPVPDGVFDSGGSGTNRIEARAVGRAVIEHARTSPKRTLGVAAFSVRQQQAILDELELLRREHRELEDFFAPQGAEPFFVKNLENVQGDERDVIFISVGYGRDAHGYLAMRFGPLGAEGGERRLNVLISRARQRCVVFSSITDEDIDLERAAGRGVAAFKTFLAFARTGRLAVAARSGREEESPFEESVRQAVESLGHVVHPQVGIAGFFIDLAVVDPTQPGRYLLGIECDGATYHSSRSARDRDRLRQAVLEDHGWIIHRVWSTDWFQRPAEQLQRISDALARARASLDAAETGTAPAPRAGEEDASAPITPGASTVGGSPGIEREAPRSEEEEAPGPRGLAVPYREARFDVPRQVDPPDMPTKDLAGVLARIVEGEGPIHEDELVNRVRDLWGFGRAGSRIQDAVAKGVRSLLVTRRCQREEGFLSLPGAVVPIRSRAESGPASVRKPEMLPPAEIRAAILALLDAGHGAKGEEIPGAVARLLGFRTTGSQLRGVIEAQRDRLVNRGDVVESNGLLKRAAPGGGASAPDAGR